MSEPTVVQKVLAHSLPPQSATSSAAAPDVVLAAAWAVPPARWPEHQDRYALEVVGAEVSGWYGPVSEATLILVRDQYAAGLIGHDAVEHRRLVHRPVTGRHHRGAHARIAYSAVELACWDLAGRANGRSVTDMLGGTVRHSVPAYASALGLDLTHPAATEAAVWLEAEGFWGQKWALPKMLLANGVHAVGACLRALREAVPHGRLMVDALGGARVDQAVALMPVLAEVGVTWAEELLSLDRPGFDSGSCHRRGVPLAAGEHAYDTHEQTRHFDMQAIDVWQVDVAWCGGLARALHTVEVAADHGLPTFPHGDSLAAAVALAGTCCRDTVPAVEYHVTLEPTRQSIMHSPAVARAGTLDVRTAPGLSGGYLVDTRQPPIVLAGSDRT